MENEILTVKQAAEILKRSGTAVRTWLQKGILPGERFGRSWMIKREDVENFVPPKRGRPVRGEEVEGRVIYFIQAGEDGPIKIGTTFNVRRRLGKLQCDNPVEMRSLGVIKGTRSQEITIQRNFAHLCIRGEWYKPEKELLSFIEENDESNEI